MTFQLLDPSAPHVVYACLGGFVVLFGMFSLFLREKLYVGEACWAFLFGVIVGPYGANIFNPRGWGGDTEATTNAVTLEFTRVVLAIGVFAIGVELPKAYMARHWKSLFFLLVPVMTWGWFVSAGLIYALIPNLNFLSSLAVAACLTPTDPILAAAVVGGKYADKHVPAHLRHLLAAESGCNDGAAFPFLYIALYLTLDYPNTAEAIKNWFLLLWLYQIILGIVIGALLGFGFRYLMRFCERNNLIDRQSYVAQYISLAILTIGICTILGSDDLLSAFSCGTAFAWDGFFNRQTEQAVFSSVIDLLFNIAAFVYVGAWMPFKDFDDAVLSLTVWRLVVIAILILLLRRLPVMIALYRWIPDVKTFREAIFSGHFGPIGIGAVFISTLAAGQLPIPADPPANQQQMLAASIQPIVSFMVLCSITIHGLSIPFFSLGRRVHSVSRTWSRHEPTAEWTNQARHIERGADIVINRDSVMERGDLTPDEKLALESRRASEAGTEAAVVGEVDGVSHVQEHREDQSSETQAEESPDLPEEKKDETPPDGTETRQEWKEGPHRVIERRKGPGEEVEVEVIRNAYASGEGQTISSSFRGTRDAVHRHLGTYMDKLKAAPADLEKDVEKFEKDIQKVEENVRHKIQEAEHKAKEALSPQSSREEEEDRDEADRDEEDEGWASDNGDLNQASSSTAPPPTEQRKRSKSPKQKAPPKAIRPAPAVPRRGRRRYSIRRGLLGHVHQSMHSPPQESAIDDSDSEDEERGRSPVSEAVHPSRSTSISSRSSVRPSRVNTIRSLESRSGRDSSPARSVRFADDGPRSGTNTPRMSLTGIMADFPYGADADTSPGDDGDSRNRVTFDLSKPPRP